MFQPSWLRDLLQGCHCRQLVANAAREALPAAAALPEAGGAALLALAAAQDHLGTVPAAPVIGLCLVGVG